MFIRELHTHFTVFNASFDKAEHCWKELEARGMYDAIRYDTAVYRNELAKRVQQTGYSIRPAKHGFEIEGVTEAVLKQFSKRAQQRDGVMQEMEAKLGRKLSNGEFSHAVHQSRAKKIKGISTAEVRERQLSQLSADERQSLQNLRASARASSLPHIALVANQVLNHAVAHVFERKSVVPEHELLSVALAHA
jgi:conjugative relaxase-like TrwC/TraI family protein